MPADDRAPETPPDAPREGPDLLAGARWECAPGTPGGGPVSPRDLEDRTGDWLEAQVPGTVAGAYRAAGRVVPPDLDAADWWFRTSVATGPGPAVLELDGLATRAEVWVDDELVATSESMFVPVRVALESTGPRVRIAIRLLALAPELERRRPRARWRVARLTHRNLRWVRTSLLGRLRGVVPSPPPVGPWRAVRLVPLDARRVTDVRLDAVCVGAVGGRVRVRATVASDGPWEVAAGEVRAPALVGPGAEPGTWELTADLALDRVERWWPATHGEQPLYDVVLHGPWGDVPLGRVGFRTVTVDRTAGAFQLVVNDVPVFVRGACWTPLDTVTLNASREDIAGALQLVVDGNLNMLRVSGDTVYEADTFYDLCDELGVLVWQDCMLAFYDPPDDPAWCELFLAEVRAQLGRLAGRPSLAVVSGGSEIAQQATYFGVPLTARLPLLTETLPAVVAETVGPVPYVPTSPWGGDVPTRPDTGVAHYYGVGAYLRPLDDARTAAPRFAAECLAFAVPPPAATVDEAFGGPAAAGHRPDWKAAVFRDAGASWDFEDVRDHYVRELCGVDPFLVRYADPERYLDLGRAVCAYLYAEVFAEWRRAGSPSSGGLVLCWRDVVPGAGLGLVDALGRPKAPWYAMRRVLAPVAVTISDEGLNGLVGHVFNDTADPVRAVLKVRLHGTDGRELDASESEVEVPARGSLDIGIDALFDGFRDLAWSHRFGPLTYRRVVATLELPDGSVTSAERWPGSPLDPDHLRPVLDGVR